jgi:hypothetical protein
MERVLSEIKGHDGGRAVGTAVAKDDEPVVKPLGDSWASSEPVGTEPGTAPQPKETATTDGKPTIRPLGDSWASSEPADRPQGDSWASGEPADGGQ